jgi:carbon starvation protein
MTVLVISFAATTLDTATRIQRFIIAEIGTTISIRLLQNRYIATILALFPSLILTMWNVQNTRTGEFTQAGWALWPIFGASNQMLSALILMILSLYFFLRKKPVLPLVLPFLFITVITLTALILKIQAFWGTNRPLAIISIILFVFVLWMLVEGCVAFKKGKRHQNF